MAGATLVPYQLSLPGGKTLPPSIPLIISSQDNWNPLSCTLETSKQDPNNNSLKVVDDAIELLRGIDKPLAVLSICGPYRSGKSYFISRVLGNPGAFKLGHSMQACTHGIWMATTVLECQDFAVVLLDTEGIDAVRASEMVAMSLLTLTTLLSSFLIYNSKKVPQKVDLDKIRCFSHLSTSLLAQCGDLKVKKAFFPHFLWLLRDVSLIMTDREGKELGPTEFLYTRVLASESGELTELGKSLVSLFPSLECATLPIPSIKRDIICGIVKQQDKLKPAFNTAVDALIQQILQKVAPKKAVDGTTTVTGKALAALAGGYVEAVNRPGALPDLDQGWQAVVRLELKEVSYKLVREYEREMEEALEGNLPMEERNLLRIHTQILNGKTSVLREKICHVNPLHSCDEEVQPLLDQLEQDIVQWSQPNNDGVRKVTGGSLHQFTEKNLLASKTHCEILLTNLVIKSKVQEKFQTAVSRSQPADIRWETSEITEKYLRRAVGPAVDEVLERGLLEFSQLSDILKKIPSYPQNVKVIGERSDCVKLSWDPPAHNPDAVEVYVVYKKHKGGEWEEAVRTEKTKVLVIGIKSSTRYVFSVVATNSLIQSYMCKTSVVTKDSVATEAGKGCSNFTLGLPQKVFNKISPQPVRECGDYVGVLPPTGVRRVLLLGLFGAAVPVAVLLSPVLAPAGAAVGAVHAATHSTTGDVSEE